MIKETSPGAFLLSTYSSPDVARSFPAESELLPRRLASAKCLAALDSSQPRLPAQHLLRLAQLVQERLAVATRLACDYGSERPPQKPKRAKRQLRDVRGALCEAGHVLQERGQSNVTSLWCSECKSSCAPLQVRHWADQGTCPGPPTEGACTR